MSHYPAAAQYRKLGMKDPSRSPSSDQELPCLLQCIANSRLGGRPRMTSHETWTDAERGAPQGEVLGRTVAKYLYFCRKGPTSCHFMYDGRLTQQKGAWSDLPWSGEFVLSAHSGGPAHVSAVQRKGLVVELRRGQRPAHGRLGHAGERRVERLQGARQAHSNQLAMARPPIMHT